MIRRSTPSRSIAIAPVTRTNEIILTAPKEEILTFLLAHSESENAFGSDYEFRQIARD